MLLLRSELLCQIECLELGSACEMFHFDPGSRVCRYSDDSLPDYIWPAVPTAAANGENIRLQIKGNSKLRKLQGVIKAILSVVCQYALPKSEAQSYFNINENY